MSSSQVRNVKATIMLANGEEIITYRRGPHDFTKEINGWHHAGGFFYNETPAAIPVYIPFHAILKITFEDITPKT